MTLKVKATYIGIILVLVTSGYLFSFHFWWIDMDGKFLVPLSCGIIWFGAIYFGFFISRLTSFREFGNHYIGLTKLINSNFLKDSLGIKKVNRLKKLNAIYSFSFFFLVLAILQIHTKKYASDQLNRHGIHQKTVVEDISFLNGRRISFEYDYNQKKYQKALHSDRYAIGDTVSITFSSYNPDIVCLDKKKEKTQ